MDLVDLQKWILPAATAVGAWGGFPEPPRMFKNLVKNEIFQYLLVAVLVWQGGGQQNLRVALTIAVAMYLLVKGMEMAKL